MPKRIFLITAMVLVLLGALPLIGNMSVTALIDAQLETLTKNGVEVSAADDESSYLLSKMHYRFRLEDKEKLNQYLQTLSTTQLPSYLYALLDSVELAADVSYSNLPFQDDVTLELYPVSLLKGPKEKLGRSDPKLLASLEKMIAEKTLLYHLNYNTAAQSFNGYLKDINDAVAFEDGTTAEISLQSVTFRGNGSLVAPQESAVAIKEARSRFDHPEKGTMRFVLESFRYENSLGAKESYEATYTLQNASLFYEEQNATFDWRADGVELFTTTEAEEGRISGASDFRGAKMRVGDENGSLTMQNIALKVSAEGVDEDAYKALEEVSRRSRGTMADLIDFMASLEALFAKGFSLAVERFSAESLSINDAPPMNGFEHTLQMVVRPDGAALQKLGDDPEALLKDIDANATLRFSDDLYAYLRESGLVHGIDAYARDDGDSTVFDITLGRDGVVINGSRSGGSMP
jgi:hypothetical protein